MVNEEEKKAECQPTQKKEEVKPSKEKIEQDRRIAELNQLRITTTTEVPPARPVISVDGIPLFELADIGGIKGKQKCGKTSVLKTLCSTWMIGSWNRLKSNIEGARILWLDTEQKSDDVKRIINDIKQMSGVDDSYIDSHLKLYTFRTLSYKTMMEDTLLLVRTYRPDVVIVDGIVDFVESFNEEVSCHKMINEIVRISEVYQCAIITVLHENKGEDNHQMRGHLGTMLAQKASTIIQCKKDSTGAILVTSSDSRHMAIPDWKIKYDEYGNIVSADQDSACAVLPNEQVRLGRVESIKAIIQENGDEMLRKDLTEKLQEAFNLSRTTVANIISKELGVSLIEENGMIKVKPEPTDSNTDAETDTDSETTSEETSV